MLIRISGGSSGIGEYLAEGKKSGRYYSRDELDQRFLLSGDLQHMNAILDCFDLKSEHEKYMHITLSFKEKVIAEDVLQAIDQEFRQFIFAACAEGEFYYYSEGHLPKIQSLPDVFGSEHERFPHIHAVIPEFNLITGKRENPLGKIEHITHYINAFQETINQKYGLESPKDNVRPISGGTEAILNRYRISPEMSASMVKEKIANIIQADVGINSVEKLAEVLKNFGEVKVRDSVSFGERYINFRFSGDKKAVNLKDPMFLNAYLGSRDPLVIKGKEKDNYPKLVEEWIKRRAFEVRFIDRASVKKREIYRQMTEEEQLVYLADLFAAKVKQTESITTEEMLPSVPNDERLPQWQYSAHFDDTRHIDDIPHFDDLPHIDDLEYIDNQPFYIPDEIQGEYIEQLPEHFERSTRHNLHDLLPRPGDGNRGGRKTVEPHSLPAHALVDLDGNPSFKFEDVYRLRDGGAISLFEQYTPAAGDVNWTERMRQIDLHLLLDYLAYHYRIQRDDFTIEQSPSGVERIGIAGRRYSPSDLMRKYLNLRWPEIRKVLDTVWEEQQKQSVIRTRDVTSRMLWHRWWQHEMQLPGIRAAYARYRTARSEIWRRLHFTSDGQQSLAQNRARRRVLQQQRRAELQRLQETWQRDEHYYRQPQRERYREWLFQEAEQGDVLALDELYRVTRYSRPDGHLQLYATHKQQQSPFAPFDLGMKVHIKRNGEIEYRDDKEKTVIIDAKYSIKVIRRDSENIAKALRLAQQRFGVNAFEIRNARPEDQQAIQAAVNKVRTEAKLVQHEDKGRSSIERGR